MGAPRLVTFIIRSDLGIMSATRSCTKLVLEAPIQPTALSVELCFYPAARGYFLRKRTSIHAAFQVRGVEDVWTYWGEWLRSTYKTL